MMAFWGTDDIANDVRRLLDHCVRSVGHLETLLFLYDHRERTWSAIEISRELRTNEAMAEHQLEELCFDIVEKAEGGYRFVTNEQNDAVLQKLTELYRERRHAIINYIYSKPPDALRSFADAFRIKKD
jgi:hypothetical protein